jgi:hypothetical protein
LESDLSLLSQWTNSSSAVAAAIGGPLGSALDQDMAWRAQYQGWVNSAPQPGIITMPDGSQQIVSMQQAGVNPYVIVGLTAAAGLAAAILYYHHNTVAGFIAQAQAIMAQTGMAQNAAAEATALNAQADHVQATNPTAAAQYRKQAQTILNTAGTIAAGGTGATPPPAPPVDWSAWIQKNAVLIVILGGAIFLGPSLIKKI